MYDIVLKYESFLNKLSVFIEKGPYKLDYFLEKLQISRSTFYKKRKSNNFSLDEVKILAKLYDDINISERLEKQINEGLKDIEEGKIYDFDRAVTDSRLKYSDSDSSQVIEELLQNGEEDIINDNVLSHEQVMHEMREKYGIKS